MLTPYRRWSKDPFYRAMDELLQDVWNDERDVRQALSGDIYETDNAIVVETAVPGIKPSDIAISVTGNILTITGEVKREESEEKRNYHQQQLRYGAFSQTVTLPTHVEGDKAEAHFTHGMLKITLPKKEEAKPKQIEVKVRQ